MCRPSVRVADLAVQARPRCHAPAAGPRRRRAAAGPRPAAGARSVRPEARASVADRDRQHVARHSLTASPTCPSGPQPRPRSGAGSARPAAPAPPGTRAKRRVAASTFQSSACSRLATSGSNSSRRSSKSSGRSGWPARSSRFWSSIARATSRRCVKPALHQFCRLAHDLGAVGIGDGSCRRHSEARPADC